MKPNRNRYVLKQSMKQTGFFCLTLIAAAALSACGGGSSSQDQASAQDLDPNDAFNEQALAVSTASANTLTVRARGMLAQNIGPLMTVRINGQNIQTIEVRNTAFADLAFSLPAAIQKGDKIDLVFTNDAYINGEDRNLLIESITVNNSTVKSDGVLPNGATYDVGDGAAAFDGQNTYTGKQGMAWNGAMRFVSPVGPTSTQPPTTSGSRDVVVSAKGMLAQGVGPLMTVMVNCDCCETVWLPDVCCEMSINQP